jgi:hypothetical protein
LTLPRIVLLITAAIIAIAITITDIISSATTASKI